VTVSTKILYGFKKDSDWVPSSDWVRKGDTKDPDGFNNGPGVQKGGFWLVSQGGGADPTKLKQASQFTDAEMLDVEDLLTALDKGVKGALSKPAKGEMLNGAEFLNRLFSIVEEGRNLCKKANTSNSGTKSTNQQPDSIMVEYYKETISGNQVFHHHSSKFVSVKDTVDGIIKGDKTERINRVRK
jgi:hypothetical protein